MAARRSRQISHLCRPTNVGFSIRFFFTKTLNSNRMSSWRTPHSELIDNNARVLWDYLTDVSAPRVSDFMLVLGSHDTRVAERAAELFNQGLAHWFIASGGYGKGTQDLWHVPEAN